MTETLTLEEQATNYHTMRHIERVRNLLNEVVQRLLARGEAHDQSKLCPPEVGAFTVMTPKLAACTYGSEEYRKFLAEMRPALEHHYFCNRHHPEHHVNGVLDMNLIDILEMICDWVASSSRHNDGCILCSIRINQPRFRYTAELASILRNTAVELGGIHDCKRCQEANVQALPQ